MRNNSELEKLLEERILEVAKDSRMFCEEAFAISQELDVPKQEVGMAANRLGIKISNCQLGCF